MRSDFTSKPDNGRPDPRIEWRIVYSAIRILAPCRRIRIEWQVFFFLLTLPESLQSPVCAHNCYDIYSGESLQMRQEGRRVLIFL